MDVRNRTALLLLVSIRNEVDRSLLQKWWQLHCYAATADEWVAVARSCGGHTMSYFGGIGNYINQDGIPTVKTLLEILQQFSMSHIIRVYLR